MASTATTSSGGGGGGGPATGGTGSPESVTVNGIQYTLTPTTNGIGNPGTAYPNDTITWTVTTSPADPSRLMYIWVDNNAVPTTTWVEGVNDAVMSLDNNGTGTFSLTVVGSPPSHNLFRMYAGFSLYQGFVTHGFIGV